MKTLFIQVSSQLIGEKYQNTPAYRHYDNTYSKPGYWRSPHYWEIPLWIAEATYFIPGEHELMVITSKDQQIETDAKLILCSVMDANQDILKDVLSRYKGDARIIAGSYTNFSLPGVTVLDNMKALALAVGVEYKQGLNFELFKGEKTIPRLTMSTGCKNSCRFCATTKKLTTRSDEDIMFQAGAFSALRFKYVYVADSTFGQAENYNILGEVYKYLQHVRPEFEGFIVQTTATQLNKPGFVSKLWNLGVRIVEIGMESYNDEILKAYRKPANTRLIKNAVDSLHYHGIKVILNIIIGLPEETRETYENTLSFIRTNPVYGYNIYNLAIYKGSELDQEIQAETPADRSEHELEKSYLDKEKIKLDQWFYNQIFSIV